MSKVCRSCGSSALGRWESICSDCSKETTFKTQEGCIAELTQALSASRAECEGLRSALKSIAWGRPPGDISSHNAHDTRLFLAKAERLAINALATQRANSENEK